MICKTESRLQALRWLWLRLKPRLPFTTQVGLLYDIVADEAMVKIKAIGYKEHNRLYFRGKEYPL